MLTASYMFWTYQLRPQFYDEIIGDLSAPSVIASGHHYSVPMFSDPTKFCVIPGCVGREEAFNENAGI